MRISCHTIVYSSDRLILHKNRHKKTLWKPGLRQVLRTAVVVTADYRIKRDIVNKRSERARQQQRQDVHQHPPGLEAEKATPLYA